MLGKKAALSQKKIEKSSRTFYHQRQYERLFRPFKPERSETEENKAIYYTKIFNDLTSGEVNLSKLLHANMGFLKTFTKSSYGYVYLVQKNRLYFSTPNTDETENDHWLIEENSPRIAAAVAYQKEFVVISDVRKQERFLLGCHIADIYDIPKSLLCVPLVTPSDVCFGVIELQRQEGSPPYGMSDIKTIVAITGWIGATVHQSWERRRHEKNLELVDSFAEFLHQCLKDDSDVDTLITDFTNLIKDHLGAERCVFYKSDYKEDESVIYAFEESLSAEKCELADHMFQRNTPVQSKDDQGLLTLALKSREIINIEDVYDPRFNPYKDGKRGGVNVRNVLVLPVWSSTRPLGVLMIINKVGALRFKSNDENILKKLRPYMAAALIHNYYREHNHNRQLEINYYRDLVKKQLMPCRHDETFKKVQQNKVDEIFPKVVDPLWYIKPTEMDIIDSLLLNMIVDVINEPGMNVSGIQRMILWTRTGYRNVQYHNFEHAFNVTQCIYSVIKRNPNRFRPIEKKGLVIAALFHDIDHPGYNNNFFHLTRQPLAKLYPESTLENHHFSVALSFLKLNQLFDDMTKASYSMFLTEIKLAILATDFAQYFQNRSDLCRLLVANEFQWDNASHRNLVKGCLMTFADISGLLKDFEVVKRLTNKLYSEFYYQGDIETALGYSPVSMMDRKKRHMVPKDQYHFMNVIVIPCAELLTNLFLNIQVSLDRGIEIRNTWTEIMQNGQKYWESIDTFEEEEKQTFRNSVTGNAKYVNS